MSRAMCTMCSGRSLPFLEITLRAFGDFPKEVEKGQVRRCQHFSFQCKEENGDRAGFHRGTFARVGQMLRVRWEETRGREGDGCWERALRVWGLLLACSRKCAGRRGRPEKGRWHPRDGPMAKKHLSSEMCPRGGHELGPSPIYLLGETGGHKGPWGDVAGGGAAREDECARRQRGDCRHSVVPPLFTGSSTPDVSLGNINKMQLGCPIFAQSAQ